MCDGYFIAVAEENLEQNLLVRHHAQAKTEVCGSIPTDTPVLLCYHSICFLILDLVGYLFWFLVFWGWGGVCLFLLFKQDLFLTATVLVFSILILAVFSSLDSWFLDFSCRCLTQGHRLCAEAGLLASFVLSSFRLEREPFGGGEEPWHWKVISCQKEGRILLSATLASSEVRGIALHGCRGQNLSLLQ